MSTYGITVTLLATALAGAGAKDEAPEEGGFDLSAGMFGKHVSDWISEIAGELIIARRQRDELAMVLRRMAMHQIPEQAIADTACETLMRIVGAEDMTSNA